jgi:hypothetical protein
LQALPELAGNSAVQENRPWIMVCAHQAGAQLFGAERSLMDLLQAFQIFLCDTAMRSHMRSNMSASCLDLSNFK